MSAQKNKSDQDKNNTRSVQTKYEGCWKMLYIKLMGLQSQIDVMIPVVVSLITFYNMRVCKRKNYPCQQLNTNFIVYMILLTHCIYISCKELSKIEKEERREKRITKRLKPVVKAKVVSKIIPGLFVY